MVIYVDKPFNASVVGDTLFCGYRLGVKTKKNSRLSTNLPIHEVSEVFFVINLQEQT